MSTLYAGPGKVFINSISLQPEGETGPVRVTVQEATAQIAAALFGRVGEQHLDETAEIVTRPFDNWGALATLFPPYLGASVGAVPGVLAVGHRPHAGSVVPFSAGPPAVMGSGAVVWTPDGRLYNPVLAAVVGHPSLHLGVGKALFGDCRIACIGDPTKNPGDTSFLFSSNAITESGSADPNFTPMTLSDFVREEWLGTWTLNYPGQSQPTPLTIEAEEEWTVEVDARYHPLKVQGQTRAMMFDSVDFMVRVRPVGPSHTQLMNLIGSHTHGLRLGSWKSGAGPPPVYSATSDLVLTSQTSSKTITLKNAEVRGAGFDFGGTTLGTGEVGFVNLMQFIAGVPQPLIVFSA